MRGRTEMTRSIAACASSLLVLSMEMLFEKSVLTTKITKATKGSDIYPFKLRAFRVLRGESVFSSRSRLGHAGAIVLFLLTVCTLVPDYLRPKVLFPATHVAVVSHPM